MERIDKSVFISYRRTNFPWALAIWQHLTQHGYDVFIDYDGIGSGDFESVILENIAARAHFIIVLTPSALERCGEPADLMRREIEAALDSKRNVVSLMLEGFSFSTPAIANQLTGKLAPIKRYNALSVPNEYFHDAMARLCGKFLNVPLAAVIHPPSAIAKQAATAQNAAAEAAAPVQEQELTAQQYAERGFVSSDPDEQIRFYSEAVRLAPNFPVAYYNRAFAHQANGDLDAMFADWNEAIRLDPNLAEAYVNRASERNAKGDLDGALSDYSEAIRLEPNNSPPYNHRAIAHEAKGDVDGAQSDYSEAIRLRPDYSEAYYNRGGLRRAKGDVDGAIADYRKYLETGGGDRDGDTEEVEGRIRTLQEKLETKAPKS